MGLLDMFMPKESAPGTGGWGAGQPQGGLGLLDPQMQQYMQQQRQQQWWGQIANAGMGILQASMGGADFWPALAQGLGAAGAAPQQQPGLLEMLKFQKYGKERAKERDEESRYATLVGGRDPKTGIDWQTGRVQGQAPATRLAGSGAAPGGPTVGLLEQPSGGGLLDPWTQTVPGRLGFTPEQQGLLQSMGPARGMGTLEDRAFAEPKAPAVKTFYDQSTGREYKGQWNPGTKQWDRVGGLKTRGSDLTLSQRANNAEIDAARAILERKGLDKAEIARLTQKASFSGRPNHEYDETLDRVVRTATQRKTGDDSDFPRIYRAYLGPAPEFSESAGPKALPPGVSAEKPGLFQRSYDALFGGDDSAGLPTPAGGTAVSRPTTPRPGFPYRGRPSGSTGQPSDPPRMANGGIDRNRLVPGKVYRHPVDGKTYRWNGQEFVAVR